MPTPGQGRQVVKAGSSLASRSWDTTRSRPVPRPRTSQPKGSALRTSGPGACWPRKARPPPRRRAERVRGRPPAAPERSLLVPIDRAGPVRPSRCQAHLANRPPWPPPAPLGPAPGGRTRESLAVKEIAEAAGVVGGGEQRDAAHAVGVGERPVPCRLPLEALLNLELAVSLAARLGLVAVLGRRSRDGFGQCAPADGRPDDEHHSRSGHRPCGCHNRASSGIGEATARALAASGLRVVLLARRADRIQALAGELGDRVMAVQVDVTDRGSLYRGGPAFGAPICSCPSPAACRIGWTAARGSAKLWHGRRPCSNH